MIEAVAPDRPGYFGDDREMPHKVHGRLRHDERRSRGDVPRETDDTVAWDRRARLGRELVATNCGEHLSLHPADHLQGLSPAAIGRLGQGWIGPLGAVERARDRESDLTTLESEPLGRPPAERLRLVMNDPIATL